VFLHTSSCLFGVAITASVLKFFIVVKFLIVIDSSTHSRVRRRVNLTAVVECRVPVCRSVLQHDAVN